jgi:hypothetical protein
MVSGDDNAKEVKDLLRLMSQAVSNLKKIVFYMDETLGEIVALLELHKQSPSSNGRKQAIQEMKTKTIEYLVSETRFHEIHFAFDQYFSTVVDLQLDSDDSEIFVALAKRYSSISNLVSLLTRKSSMAIDHMEAIGVSFALPKGPPE